MRKFLISVCVLALTWSAQAALPIADTPFPQQYHEAYPLGSAEANDVRHLALDDAGVVYAATRGGVFALRDGIWAAVPGVVEGASYAFHRDGDTLYAGAWDGLYAIQKGRATKAPGIDDPISAIGATPEGILALGPDSSFQYDGATWRAVNGPWSKNVRAVLPDPENGYWVATGMGLYRNGPEGDRFYIDEKDIFSCIVNDLEVGPDGRLWAALWGGIDVFTHGHRTTHYGADNGLPAHEVRGIDFAPDGTLWAATNLGAVAFDGTTFHLRHTKRWVLSNDVRDVVVSDDGTVWLATARGVSAIRTKMMTMADKAEHFYKILLERHVRDPWIVEKCKYPDPNDRTKWVPMDDDNDGEYTGIYLAMEAYRYAVTRDPSAKERADNAFDTLELFQTVTETPGFFARTVVPVTWDSVHDGNRTYSQEEQAESRARDPRYKPVETRWRPSADGRWLWKGDTSSDEVTGHFAAFGIYYDLVADEKTKPRVQQHVRNIMDYLIDGGYVFRDIDGKATRWGVWAPEMLLHDGDWVTERPINATELLSFLKTTYHITGDEKYQREYERMINDYGYAELARRPKAYGYAQRSYIDDELHALTIPGLLRYEEDPALRSKYMEGYVWAYGHDRDDMNPWFTFQFHGLGGQDAPLDEGVFFLRDHPLDLTQWLVDSAQREDVGLRRWPMPEPMQTDRMLPPSERGVMRWDKNPWEAISGDFSDQAGTLESCGVHWLMPYWMGRYYGIIAPPNK